MSIHMRTAIAAVLFLAGTNAWTQTLPAEASLASLSTEADLVFQGTVTEITYATSIEGIPHTFVTYRVEDVLKGERRITPLTLRFIGGIKVDGNVLRKLSVSHAPRFELGQQDVLMVRGNGEAQCPLVRCAQGRFRFVDGLVTTEGGDVLAREPQGGVRIVPPQAERAGPGDYGAEAGSSATADAPLTAPFDPSGFVAHLRQVIGLQRAATTRPVESADPTQPFKGPEPAVAGPPIERAASPRPAPVRPRGLVDAAQTERDRLEAEALRRNEGNPVLPAADVEAIRRASGASSAR